MGYRSRMDEKLDKINNYTNSLKLYCENIQDKEVDIEEFQDNMKYLDMLMEHLVYMMEQLLWGRQKYVYEFNTYEDRIELLKKSYMLSEKCVLKIQYIEGYLKKVEGTLEAKTKKEVVECLPKVINYYEEILDEIMDFERSEES